MQRDRTRVVVTGASGFIGTAVMRRLGESDVEALGVTRGVHQGFVSVPDYTKAPRGDVLIHLAESNNRATVNAQGNAHHEAAINTMHALLDRGYSRIVYASSAALYGDEHAHPHRETDTLVLDDTYAQTKAALESVVSAVGGTIARLTNIIGCGMSRSNVAWAILAQLDKGGTLLLRDTSAVRDFLWVDDAAEALSKMALNNIPGTFNVGTGRGISIASLARGILDVAGQRDRLVQSAVQGSKPSHLVVDATAALKTYGWQASTDLSHAARRLVDQVDLERR